MEDQPQQPTQAPPKPEQPAQVEQPVTTQPKPTMNQPVQSFSPKKSKKGLLLLVIILLLLAGAAAWFFLMRYKTGAPVETAQQSTTTTTQTPTTETAPAADATAYVTIDEWGIKIPTKYLPTGFTYEFSTTINTPLVLNSTDLKAGGCTAEGSGFIIIRGTDADYYTGDDNSKYSFKTAKSEYSETRYLKVGDYHYIYDNGITCGTTENEVKARKALWDAFKYTQKV